MKTKSCFIIAYMLITLTNSYAQSNTFPPSGAVGIGTTTPNASSLLDVVSSNRGILIPRMNQTQRDNIASPATGLLIYQTDLASGFYYYSGTGWTTVSAANNGWSLTGNAGTVSGTNFLGTTDAQPLMFKINNIKAGYLDFDVAKANTGLGYQTLFSNTTGFENAANGFRALYSNTGGDANTANGSYALYSNTTGGINTANGSHALYSNTIGEGNTANGYVALYFNTIGNNNTANGYQSLYLNTAGSYNTANGVFSLYSNTTGNYNTANGLQSLTSNSTGNYNTANGTNTLYSNTSGSNNTANGYQSLYVNTIGTFNSANGSYSLYSNTTGNNNSAHGSYALYSNTVGLNNSANGFKSLYFNTTGNYNTANGSQSLYSNTTGSNNTANGYKALISNTTGIYNSGNGSNALQANTTGENNTANGYSSLYSNTTGYRNTANGFRSLYSNTIGYWNTATGVNALYSNIDGFSNTGNGYAALFSNTSGINNTANGYRALYFNTGSSNSANGYYALQANTTGADNTASGAYALQSNKGGSGNTALGNSADVSTGNLTNATVIGSSATVDASNKVRVGNTLVTSIGGQVGWTTFSDGRYKKNIKEDVKGLSFINSLQPVTYTVDINSLNEYFNKGRKDSNTDEQNKMQQSADDAAKIVYNGFIAQDVEKAAQSIGYNFSGVDKPQTKDGLYGLRYAEFVVPLVKAVQELDLENARLLDGQGKLRMENSEQQKQIDELKESLAQLQSSSCAKASENKSMTDGFAKLEPLNTKPESILGQNIPNPFDNSTLIPFRIPKNCKDASIMITNTSSSEVISVIPISCNEDHVSIDAGVLASGTYSYSLYVDGTLIQTKHMAIVR